MSETDGEDVEQLVMEKKELRIVILSNSFSLIVYIMSYKFCESISIINR